MAKAKKELENTNNYWYEMPVLPTQTITKEQERSIVAKIAKKHNVPSGKVRFTTKKIYPDGVSSQDTALNAEMINNIKDPKFQQELKSAGIATGNITRLAGGDCYGTSEVIARWAVRSVENVTTENDAEPQI